MTGLVGLVSSLGPPCAQNRFCKAAHRFGWQQPRDMECFGLEMNRTACLIRMALAPKARGWGGAEAEGEEWPSGLYSAHLQSQQGGPSARLGLP